MIRVVTKIYIVASGSDQKNLEATSSDKEKVIILGSSSSLDVLLYLVASLTPSKFREEQLMHWRRRCDYATVFTQKNSLFGIICGKIAFWVILLFENMIYHCMVFLRQG